MYDARLARLAVAFLWAAVAALNAGLTIMNLFHSSVSAAATTGSIAVFMGLASLIVAAIAVTTKEKS